MTAEDLKYSFLLAYDKAFEGASPAYDDAQISEWLTQAQVRVFTKYYAKFEETEDARRAIDPLIKSYTATTFTAGNHPNGYFVELPSDFMYAIEEAVTLTDLTSETRVVPIKHDFYQINRLNPYKRPNNDVVWRMDIGTTGSKNVELITDGTLIDEYRLQYIQHVTNIVVDSYSSGNNIDPIIDPTVQYEIVTEAVKMAVAATKPDEYQIAINEVNSN